MEVLLRDFDNRWNFVMVGPVGLIDRHAWILMHSWAFSLFQSRRSWGWKAPTTKDTIYMTQGLGFIDGRHFAA